MPVDANARLAELSPEKPPEKPKKKRPTIMHRTSMPSKEEAPLHYKTTYCCCCTCAAFCCLLQTGIALFVWFLLGAYGGRFMTWGPNWVPMGYGADLVGEMYYRQGGYASAFCEGRVEGCTLKIDFPGEGTDTVMGWANIWKLGSELPAKEWSGEWWRGNEYGFLIGTPLLWASSNINPMSMVTGILPSQHAAMRPLMEHMFNITQDSGKLVKEMMQDFFRTKDEINVPHDIAVLVQQILFRVVFNKTLSEDDSKAFVTFQSYVEWASSGAQLVPSFWTKPVFGALRKLIEQMHAQLTSKVALWSHLLEDVDCSPSKDCSTQAASMILDAFYIAYTTVPTTIRNGLGVLFSQHDTNPFQARTFKKEDALGFFWENLRYFPPVAGLPYWVKRPPCAGASTDEMALLNAPEGKTQACKLQDVSWQTGYPQVNQYYGGRRKVLNLALAQQDPVKWGADAASFRIRSLDEYSTKSVGFAEMAVNHNVAGGKMNRKCPAKALSLLIGEQFFVEFDELQWTTKEKIEFRKRNPFADSFTLKATSTSATAAGRSPSAAFVQESTRSSTQSGSRLMRKDDFDPAQASQRRKAEGKAESHQKSKSAQLAHSLAHGEVMTSGRMYK